MRRLAALLVVVAAGVVIAALFVPSPAATVGASSISRQALDSDLSAIAQSPDYACFLAEERELAGGGAIPFLGAGTASASGGVYATTFVDDWLDAMISDQVAVQVAVRHGVGVGPADVSVGRGVLSRRISGVLDEFARDTSSPEPACGGSGAAVLASLPTWFAAEQSRNEAYQAVLDARAAGAGLSAQAIARYFRSHRTTFSKDCLDLIVVKSDKTAKKVVSALVQGATFAHEASSESLTKTSAARGGEAGCGTLAGTFLSDAVAAMKIGQTSAPLSGEGAYWVVRLTSRTAVSFASSRTTVVTAIIDAGSQRASRELDAALRGTTLTVDPRYGTVSARRATLMAAPASPPATTLLSTSADVPAVTSANA